MDVIDGRETATYQEIITQTDAWEEALAVTQAHAGALRDQWDQGGYEHVLFTGCGSTYYLSLAAAALFRTLNGTPARAVPAGELVMYPDAHYAPRGRTLLVAVSRSGATTETVRAVERFLDAREGEVLVITNYADTSLSGMGDITLLIPKGREMSVAQTRSFASMYVAATALAASIAGREDLLEGMAGLPACGERLVDNYETLARSFGEDLGMDRFYFLGSGPRYGLACETNLKMKEMTLTHSEPFHFLEFRHGPMSMVTDTAVVVGLLSGAKRVYEHAVLEDMARLGARILSLGETGAEVAFESGLPETIRNVLYLPVLQLMALYRSLAKGLDPDNPTHLSSVVKLDLGE